MLEVLQEIDIYKRMHIFTSEGEANAFQNNIYKRAGKM